VRLEPTPRSPRASWLRRFVNSESKPEKRRALLMD